MSKWKIVYSIIISLAVIAFFIGFIMSSIEKGECRLNRLNKNIKCNGIVIKKKYNRPNYHANEYLILDDNNSFEWEDSHYKDRAFYDKILVGDSVVKEKGSLELWVYRQDTSFMIDLSFPCEE